MYSRVSSSAMYKNMLGTLNGNLSRYQDLIRQQSTLQKYASLSENPSAISRSIEISSEMTSNTQYQTNSQNAVSMLKYSYTAMDQILNAAQDIRDLVVQAGDGALSSDELDDIAQQIEAKRDLIIDALNTKVAGQYIFGGTNSSEKPFVVNSDGSLTYKGNDTAMAYALSETLNGVVSFTGSEVLSKNDDTFFICSHKVGLDWSWTGREEKVQITVGNRTLAIYIPENWVDEIATANTKATDYNQFRDPGEVSGISLNDLATLINRSLSEQGADMLVNAYVQSNGQTQQLFMKSLTGEEIGIVDWTDTDYLPMAQSIAGVQFTKTTSGVDIPDWNSNTLIGTVNLNEADFAAINGRTLDVYVGGTKTSVTFTTTAATTANDIANQVATALGADISASITGNGALAITSKSGKSIQIDGDSSATSLVFGTSGGLKNDISSTNGLMGTVSLMSWRDDNLGKGIKIDVGGGSFNVGFNGLNSITDLVETINSTAKANGVDCTASIAAGRLVLQSKAGEIKVTDSGTAGGTAQLFGVATGTAVESSTSSLTIQVGTDTDSSTVIYINKDDTLTDIADKINAIQGVYARTSADKDQLVVVAQRIGDPVGDYLSVDAAKESAHYPSITVTGQGAAIQLFDFSVNMDDETGVQVGSISSTLTTRAVDHSHMDVFSVLGMETALKSKEFGLNDKVEVAKNTTLNWRIMSGDHTAEIMLTPGEYTLDQIADRLNTAAAGWLNAVVDVAGMNSDEAEPGGFVTSYNSEAATQRLVIRGINGQEVLLVDLNEQRYADELGISTALRTDSDTGVKNIVFPDAACVDDNIGVQMRVQMNCGMTYDITLRKADVTDPASGLVVREKVMEQIVKQVNAQEGKNIMGITYPSKDGSDSDMASIYFLSGEPFTVVDLPFNDPAWSDYSGGIAAQLGIHGGVTSNLAKVGGGITDSQQLGSDGVIKVETLGQTITVTVRKTDTVKDVMDRLRAQAGDALYVNYFDAHMGNSSASRSGDYPIISISAVDGSAVSITDVSGTIAQNILGISTGVQGSNDVTGLQWDIGETPGMVFEINVAGYTHKIDMTAMTDTNNNGKMDCEDLVATINARMQDYDLKAEINDDGHLVLSSLRGYSFSAEAYFVNNEGGRVSVYDGTGTLINLTNDFFGTAKKNTDGEVTTYYRGGYHLEQSASSRTDGGIYTQNVTLRSGSNTTTQTAYEMFSDLTEAVRAGNRDALSEKMLPRIDAFINDVLSLMSTNGALQNRYEANYDRLVDYNTTLSEEQQNLVGIDLADVATAIAEANYAYSANLYAISALMSMPTLLDFMS